MKTISKHLLGLLLWASFLWAPFALAGEVATVQVSEAFLNQLEVKGRKTQPFLKQGQVMKPNMVLSVKGQVVTNPNGAITEVKADLWGYTTTETNRRIIGRTVSVHVKSDISGSYKNAVSLGPKGLTPGQAEGGVTITPEIHATNTFRRPRINARVNARAEGIAESKVNALLPQEEQLLRDQMSSDLESGIREGNRFVSQSLAQANSLLADPKLFPFTSQFSGKAGAGGYLKMNLVDDQSGKQREAPPSPSKGTQAATSMTLHEDVLNDSIGPQIAGKTVLMGNLKDYLCGPRTSRVLDFCRKDVPEALKGLEIRLDGKKPVEFVFQDGKIILRLNAIYTQTTMGAKLETQPYTVESVYKLGDGEATLESLTVKDNPNGTSSPSATGDHQAGSPPRQTLSPLFTGLVKAKLETNFRQVMKPKFTFGTVSFPTKIARDEFGNPNVVSKPRMTEAGSLVPLSVQAEKGWLSVSHYFCSESTLPMGVVLNTGKMTPRPGVVPTLTIESVYAGSPAALSGLRPGDRIDTFGLPGERAATSTGASAPFFKLIADTAKLSTSTTRTVELSGVDSKGVPFKKAIALCPSQLNHRAEAEKTLNIAKDLAR